MIIEYRGRNPGHSVAAKSSGEFQMDEPLDEGQDESHSELQIDEPPDRGDSRQAVIITDTNLQRVIKECRLSELQLTQHLPLSASIHGVTHGTMLDHASELQALKTPCTARDSTCTRITQH